MLELTGVGAAYNGVPALDAVSLRIDEGEFAAIVGPNGAGKSTLFKTISGTVVTTGGNIHFDGADITHLPAAKRPHLGIAHVPEGRQVFPSLSVLENLEMGAYTARGRREWSANSERIFAWFPVLATRLKSLAGALSGGQQQMLAIARGLASSPRLLMLDEPSMGLAPSIADEIFERIVAIHRESRLAVLLVEQRVAEALHFAKRGYVLEAGRVVLSGAHEDLMRDDRIRQAYLGM